jgi:hypothetical protein
MMRAAVLLAACGILLAGCATPPAPPQRAAAPTTFGPWVINACTLGSKAADVWLRTTGSLTFGGDLELTAHFTPVLVRPPYATLSGLPVPIRVEGTNRRYTLFVPYNPETGAHMLQPGRYLTVSYQPLGSAAIQDVSFPTAPLMQGLGALRGC